jgi:hypothetical protein
VLLAWTVAASSALSASVTTPVTAGPLYAGIGAPVASFYARNPDGPGKPPVGVTYYRVDSSRNGRVLGYHVVVGWRSRRSASQLLARLSGRELPSDALLVKPYNGYCAVYQSRWLGKAVFGLPRRFGGRHVFRTAYIIIYAPQPGPATHAAGVSAWWNEVGASLVPICRG